MPDECAHDSIGGPRVMVAEVILEAGPGDRLCAVCVMAACAGLCKEMPALFGAGRSEYRLL